MIWLSSSTDEVFWDYGQKALYSLQRLWELKASPDNTSSICRLWSLHQIHMIWKAPGSFGHSVLNELALTTSEIRMEKVYYYPDASRAV